ncbi:MAG: penicillin-binding protein activator LpoB [Treponema sp.]|nr:penicillin-binding protein activator LpoB [Treponema sp.]
MRIAAEATPHVDIVICKWQNKVYTKMMTAMKKSLFATVLLVGFCTVAFPQTDYHTRPRLGILPFTGGVGGNEGDIAAFLSVRQEILEAFDVIPATAMDIMAISERMRHMTAFTDSDLIAGIGRMIGADYVVSGSMRPLGRQNLVIATVVNVETFELVAGYYRMYRYAWEVRGFLPSMSKSLVNSTVRRRTLGQLPSLAIAPPGLSAALLERPYDHRQDDPDLETLTQILAIEMASTGEYAVLPRVSGMRAAFNRWQHRHDEEERAAALGHLIDLLLGVLDVPDVIDGDGDGEEDDIGPITAVGQAIGIDRILLTRKFDEINTFVAQIFQPDNDSPLAQSSVDYVAIGDGVNMMAELALLLTDPYGALERIAGLNRWLRLDNMLSNPAKFWSVGFSVGTSFADPRAIGTVHGTLAPFPFFFVRLGCDVGFITGIAGAEYFSVYPFVHLAFFMPFAWGGVYAGMGAGFLVANYTFYGLPQPIRMPLVDFTAGLIVAGTIEVSYTLRVPTDFSSANGKLSVGFTHRFRRSPVSPRIQGQTWF